ncbi:MAG: glycosyltransferase family 1 protein [Pseudomonadales bacterium]
MLILWQETRRAHLRLELSKLRVGIDARPLQFLSTGIGLYTLNLVERIARMKDIQLWLYSRDSLEIDIEGVIERHAEHSIFQNSLFAQLYFPQWARQDDLQVFWSPRHHLPLLLRCPSVVTIHDLVWVKYPQTMAFGGVLLERILMPKAIKQAQRIICVSESTKRDLTEFAPDSEAKARVIYEASTLEPKEVSRCLPFFLFVGTKEPRKNLTRTLEAWAKVSRQLESFSLVIAGGDGWRYDLQADLKRLHISDSVKTVTPTSDELRDLYADCYAVVLMSLYEGFGLPLVEAMAFGKPVITSSSSAMAEIAGSAGLLANPLNSDEIAENILKLVRDQRLYRKLELEAKKRNGLFDWKNAARQTADLLKEAANLG